MHYAEFAEDEVCSVSHHRTRQLLMYIKSTALLNAIKDYEANKWKEIGKKVGKPAKVEL
jgi:hypothetical protein